MKVYTKEQLAQYDLSLTYDDISLIPTEISDVISRRDILTRTKFLGLDLGLPVISSPMDTVTGIRMALELDRLGCLGIINRFDLSIDELIKNADSNGIKAVAIGLNTDEELLEKFAERNLILCLDIANANNVRVLEQCEEIKKKHKVKMIVGNVAHGSTLKQLVDAGADAVRVGIGGGSMCTTSIQTGIGIGQVSSLVSVLLERERKNLKIEIVADGGIKGPGDIAKSIALGADAIMLGRLLAGTKETPGEVIKYNDHLWKKYRGSASFGTKMKDEFIEGEETMVSYKGSVENTINNISDGLRSSMSYLNCHSIEELKKVNQFAILSNSSYLERLPRK